MSPLSPEEELDPSLNNLHQNPLYPTEDSKPPKTQMKDKKPNKPDNSHKYNNLFTASPSDTSSPDEEDNEPQHHSNKFDFINYDEEDIAGHPSPETHGHNLNNGQGQSIGPGPGFFNPSASKTQYADFDAYGHNLNDPNSGSGKPFNPYQQNGGSPPNQPIPSDKLPPELFNILGQNPQNLQPHHRIEQLLQHIQGGQDVGAGGNIHLPSFVPQTNGIHGYPFGHDGGAELQQNLNRPGLRPPTGSCSFICFIRSLSFTGSISRHLYIYIIA